MTATATEVTIAMVVAIRLAAVEAPPAAVAQLEAEARDRAADRAAAAVLRPKVVVERTPSPTLEKPGKTFWKKNARQSSTR